MSQEQINREVRQQIEQQIEVPDERPHSKTLTNTGLQAPKPARAKATEFGPKAILRVYNMRCPSCAKLYKVEAKDISSSSPHFDCQFCRTQFTFDYPPTHPHSIQTRPLKLAHFSAVSELDFIEGTDKEFVRKCSKCGTLNSKAADECQKCQVIFSKIEGLPLEQKTGALPSLMRAWQELLGDYENVAKHIAFVDRCEDLQAIPYALRKYQALKEAQPQDTVAQEMFKKVWMKSLSTKAQHLVEVSRVRVVLDRVNWPKVIKLSPWGLYIMMVSVGAMSEQFRNLVGIGVALFFMHLGLRVFFRGGLHLEDLFD